MYLSILITFCFLYCHQCGFGFSYKFVDVGHFTSCSIWVKPSTNQRLNYVFNTITFAPFITFLINCFVKDFLFFSILLFVGGAGGFDASGKSKFSLSSSFSIHSLDESFCLELALVLVTSCLYRQG